MAIVKTDFQPCPQIINRIFVNGCLTLLQYQLETDVVPMMVGYAVVGVILALVELITVVLASAYVAQITRCQCHKTFFSSPLTLLRKG
jgi:hypothetical protein